MLYKYCPPTRSAFFKAKQIRITQPGAFNDPFDMLGASQVASRAELEALPDAPGGMKQTTPEFFERIVAPYLEAIGHMQSAAVDGWRAFPAATVAQSHFDRRYGCLSLSNSPRSVAMWSHYASNHRGFVLEFDPTHDLFKTAELHGGRFDNVIYSNERPGNTFSNLEIPSVFFTKSLEWQYEAECRLILPLAHPLVTNTGIFVEGYPLYLLNAPCDAIRGVIFGARCAPATIELVINAIKESWKGGLTVRHAQIDETKYRLNIWPAIDEDDQNAVAPRVPTSW
jgi:hypothetical protein